MLDDILQIRGGDGKNQILKDSIVNNWTIFDFQSIIEQDSALQVIKNNFPQLSNMFLDNNEKLQMSANSGPVDLVSTVSNTVGDNLDNLVRSVKLAHLELMKQGNLQILE